jgi:Family of unknown function (DUF5519)
MTQSVTASRQIIDEVGSWPGVEAGSGPRGLRLRTEGRVVDHPEFPGKSGFAARKIEDDADIRDVIELMRLNYERIRAREGLPEEVP